MKSHRYTVHGPFPTLCLSDLLRRFPEAYAIREGSQDEVDVEDFDSLRDALETADVLVWATEADAQGDNGANAIARIAAERCECGEVFGVRCDARAAVEVEFMPEHLRESHRQAGNSGEWPANGAQLLRVSEACALELIDSSGDRWVRIRDDRRDA